jgi:hypothetical protein
MNKINEYFDNMDLPLEQILNIVYVFIALIIALIASKFIA